MTDSAARASWTAGLPSLGGVMLFGLTALTGLGVDLWTKAMAVQHLKDGGRRIRLLPDWLHLEYTENHGAVFGIGQGQRTLFVVVSVLAIAFLTWLLLGSGRQWFYQFVLGLLLAGVLGNLYDRAACGYVRDMIHALPGRTWPGTRREIFPWIFNIADALLCVGVGLMLLHSLFTPSKRRRQPT